MKRLQFSRYIEECRRKKNNQIIYDKTHTSNSEIQSFSHFLHKMILTIDIRDDNRLITKTDHLKNKTAELYYQLLLNQSILRLK